MVPVFCHRKSERFLSARTCSHPDSDAYRKISNEVRVKNAKVVRGREKFTPKGSFTQSCLYWKSSTDFWRGRQSSNHDWEPGERETIRSLQHFVLLMHDKPRPFLSEITRHITSSPSLLALAGNKLLYWPNCFSINCSAVNYFTFT